MLDDLTDEDYMKLVKYIPIPEHDLRKVAKEAKRQAREDTLKWVKLLAIKFGGFGSLTFRINFEEALKPVHVSSVVHDSRGA